MRAALAKLPYRILCESFQGSNWEIVSMAADGSDPVNLTRTPIVHELYPHASPDGSKICFMADQTTREGTSRSVYCMNADGSGRVLVATKAGQPFWRADGRALGFLWSEYGVYSQAEYATQRMGICDARSGQVEHHVNHTLHHLYAPAWTPDGKWIFATVHGGMSLASGNLAIQADGHDVFQLPYEGCRADFSPDGRRVVWNVTDQAIAVAELDLASNPPRVANARTLVSCDQRNKVYHADFSPDGRFVAFAGGPSDGSQAPGVMARGWQIHVADAAQTNVYVVVTRGGISHKEPDWLAVQPAASRPAKPPREASLPSVRR